MKGLKMQNSAAQMYNYKVVRQFTIMTVVWGVIGMSVGLLVASQLVWPALNMDLPWTSFGRLRPLQPRVSRRSVKSGQG